jgi:lactate permease
MVDGTRGIRSTWPAAVVGGLAFAIGQFVCSNYISVELTDIVASLLSVGAIVAFLRLWQPSNTLDDVGGARPAVAGGSVHDPEFEAEIKGRDEGPVTGGQALAAFSPYLIIIAIFSLAQAGPIKDFLAKATQMFSWPGLDVTNDKGEPLMSLMFKFDILAAAGTLLLISGLITMLVLRISPRTALQSYGETLNQLKWAILTVASVLALAYVMNQSGQTITMGLWVAGAGGIFALFSSAIGWLGVAITGSDTSSNALFGALQVAGAKNAGLSPTLLAAANSSGGVLGKMISPQNLAIGAAAVGMTGKEGDLFRTVLKWSVALVLVMCVIVYLQSTDVLGWMVV